MAQKRTTTQQQIPTVLNVANEDFKKELSLRIEIGEELFNRNLNTNSELDKLRNDFNLWNEYNSEYLKQCFNTGDNEYRSYYTNAGWTFMGQMGEVPNNPHLTLKNLINYKLQDLKTLLAKAGLIKSEVTFSIAKSHHINRTVSKNEVFIVHGHDDTAKVKTARFIERLGFAPIILHEQSSLGKTIIEKIEEYSNVGFGIILYTKCDVGAKKGDEQNLKPRARQNVVFEHGYLIGKIGRQNVCALVKGEVETPNDISGVVYVKMDDDDAWHVKIAKELRSSGYVVDLNKL